jgi:gliding motility-associated-like protein
MKYITLPKSISGRRTSTRWWWALLRISFVLLLVHPALVFSQKEYTILDRVYINPQLRLVRIEWHTIANSPPVIDYTIQYEIDAGGQSWPVPDVDPIQPEGKTSFSTSFKYDDVFIKPVRFNILTEYGNGLGSWATNSHTTIFTSLQYDTCSNSVVVKWTPYVGWADTLAKYTVLRYPEQTIVAEVPKTVTEAKIENVDVNKNYCFFVAAIRNDGLASWSNDACITTNVPPPPTYVIGDFTKSDGGKNITLQFSADPSVTRGSYKLFRSESGSGNWNSIADFTNTQTITYTDALPALNVYDYKLTYLNSCNQEQVNSIPINNIVLTGSSEAMTNYLKWNNFESWKNGVDRQEVYRNDAPNPIATLSEDETTYSDVLSAQDQLSDNICYQVKVVSAPDQLGKTNVSESNIYCPGLLSEVFVANAFTPNNDGINDEFKPSFSLIPSRYNFMIYNRYGFKIFESSDSGKGWNGRLSDGSKALEGGYIYYFKIVSSSGKVLEKRGNFSVIYP